MTKSKVTLSNFQRLSKKELQEIKTSKANMQIQAQGSILNLKKKSTSNSLPHLSLDNKDNSLLNKSRKTSDTPATKRLSENSDFATNFHKLLTQREADSNSIRYANYLNYKMRKMTTNNSQPPSMNFNSNLSNDYPYTNETYNIHPIMPQSNKRNRNSFTKDLFTTHNNSNWSKSNIDNFNGDLSINNTPGQTHSSNNLNLKGSSISVNKDIVGKTNIFGGKARRQILNMNNGATNRLHSVNSTNHAHQTNNTNDNTNVGDGRYTKINETIETHMSQISNYGTTAAKPTQSINKYKYIFTDSSLMTSQPIKTNNQ